MLISYADDSGTHKQAKIVCLGGFLGDADEWSSLDDAWKAVLGKPEWPSRIKVFHTVDCVQQDKEFREWSYAERLAIFGDLVNVILAFPNLRALGAAVVVDHFNNLSLSDLRLLAEDKKGTPLAFVFHLMMQEVISQGYKTWPGKRIGVAFENSDLTTEAEFRDLYIDYRDGFYRGDCLMPSPAFLPKSESPLQAADILAYSTYQIAMQNIFPTDYVPHFNVIPLFSRLLEGIIHDGGLYDAVALESLMKRVRTGDPSLIGNKKKRIQE